MLIHAKSRFFFRLRVQAVIYTVAFWLACTCSTATQAKVIHISLSELVSVSNCIVEANITKIFSDKGVSYANLHVTKYWKGHSPVDFVFRIGSGESMYYGVNPSDHVLFFITISHDNPHIYEDAYYGRGTMPTSYHNHIQCVRLDDFTIVLNRNFMKKAANYSTGTTTFYRFDMFVQELKALLKVNNHNRSLR